MKQLLAGLLLSTALTASASALAAAPTQCVSNALAGGTVDAITIPLQPCGLATNLLILTLAGANATTSPTLKMAGYPALSILTSIGAAPLIGELPSAGAVVMLTGTGSSWKIVSGNATAGFTGTLTVPNGGTGRTTLTANGALYGNGTSAVGITSAGTTGTVLKGVTSSVPVFGAVALATDVTGTLPVANGGTGATTLTGVLHGNGSSAFTASTVTAAEGGTGQSSYTTGDLLYASGATALSKLGVGTSSQYLKGGSTPAWATLASDTVTTVGFGTTGLTPSAATAGVVTVAGTLAVANGGTGQTSFTNGQLLIGNTGTGGLSKATLTAGTNVTITNAAGAITITSTGLASGCGTGAAPAGQLLTADGATACTANSDATFAAGTVSLGVNTSESGALKMFGATSGNLTIKPAAVAGSSTVLTLPGGTTDFSATGGSNQVVKQTSSGGAFTVGTLACANLSDGATGCSTATGTSGATLPLLNADNTWSGTQTFSGTSGKLALKLLNAAEPSTISATAATGTINYDICTQSILYYTTSAAANWTLNLRCSSGTSLNTAMATGDTVTVTFLVTQGASPFYNNVVQVDTGAVTPKYQGGTAWSAGNASGIDAYTYAIVKTGNAAFTVLASQTQFK